MMGAQSTKIVTRHILQLNRGAIDFIQFLSRYANVRIFQQLAPCRVTFVVGETCVWAFLLDIVLCVDKSIFKSFPCRCWKYLAKLMLKTVLYRGCTVDEVRVTILEIDSDVPEEEGRVDGNQKAVNHEKFDPSLWSMWFSVRNIVILVIGVFLIG